MKLSDNVSTHIARQRRLGKIATGWVWSPEEPSHPVDVFLARKPETWRLKYQIESRFGMIAALREDCNQARKKLRALLRQESNRKERK
jgi:hypothetical protein